MGIVKGLLMIAHQHPRLLDRISSFLTNLCDEAKRFAADNLSVGMPSTPGFGIIRAITRQ